jgi:lysophospholipase L1-like esterase
VRSSIVALLVALGCAAPPARHEGPLRVVVAGDSVAHGEGDELRLGFARHLDLELARLGIAHEAPIDLAISGSRTWQLARVLARPRSRALVAKADAVVLSIGGNDLYGDSRARLFSLIAPRLMMDVAVERIASIVRTLERESEAKIVLLGVYDPYRDPWLDEYVSVWSAKLFERFADDRRVSVITIADLFIARRRISPIDGFHPNGDAYERIARRVAEAL